MELWLTENGVTKKLVYSGDIGNKNKPIIRDPQYVTEADIAVMESTYGDRNHESSDDTTEALAKIIDATLKTAEIWSSHPSQLAARRNCSTASAR